VEDIDLSSVEAETKKRHFDVGTSYFPHRRTSKYHRIEALSLLCSEWEEVGHARIKHRHQKAVRDTVQAFENSLRFAVFKSLHRIAHFLCSRVEWEADLKTVKRAPVFKSTSHETSQHWDGWRDY
jgi:hypothetical protein